MPKTTGCGHRVGEFPLGGSEVADGRLDASQGAPVAFSDETAADNALAHGGAAGVAAAAEQDPSVRHDGPLLTLGPPSRIARVVAVCPSVNLA
jgi:hypothetical protein